MSKMKKTALASAIALTLATGVVGAKTSTVGGAFIMDRTEIRPGGIVNLALLGLNAKGQVDMQGEQFGSTIVAMIKSSQCTINVEGDTSSSSSGTTGSDPGGGFFASSTKSIELDEGRGKVFIKCPTTATGTETIEIKLQEKTTNSTTGGTELKDITSLTTKTITITPSSTDPLGLGIVAFYPAEKDPRGKMDCFEVKEECPAVDDGIYGEMTAGMAGGQIVVWAKNPVASGEVTVMLKGVEEYTYTAPMTQGSATVTLDNKLTKAGEYYIEATMGDENSVQIAYPDKIKVWSTGKPKALKLYATKERVAKADFTNSLTNDQIAQGTEIWAKLVDEYGNSTTQCHPTKNDNDMTVCTNSTALNVTLDDSNNVADTTKLQLYIPASDPDGKTQAKTGDAILGNQEGELVNVGTSSLVASAFDSSGNPSTIVTGSSDPLEIQVVSNSLTAEVHSDFTVDQMAGEEFNAFMDVAVLNDKGQVHVDTSNNPINPGDVIIKSLATGEESMAPPDSSSIVRGLFEKQTGSDYRYLLSDKAGNYGQVLLEAAGIISAAASKVEFYNAHGQNITKVPATDIFPDKTYYTLIPEISFRMMDSYGNEKTGDQPLTADDTGQFTLYSSNGTVIYNTPEGNLGIPGRWLQEYADTGYPSLVAVMYEATGENQFAGEDALTVSFTKPGVEDMMLTTTVPAYQGLAEIKSYLEQDSIPVNSEVAVSVDVLDENGDLFIDPDPAASTNVTITFNEQEGDTIIPTLTQTVWNQQEGMTQEQCQASTQMIWMDDSCFEMTTMSVSSGQTLDFAQTGGRQVFIVNAGANEGQFSLNFTHTNEQGTEIKETRTITVGATIPECVTDPTTCQAKEACEKTLSVFSDNQCHVTNLRNAADTTQPEYPFDENDAKFAGGVLNRTQKETEYNAENTFSQIDMVQVAGVIQVDKEDLGKEADLLVVGYVGTPDWSWRAWRMLRGCSAEEKLNYQCPSIGWVVEEWVQDEEGEALLADLKPFKTVDALQEYHTLYIYTGNLNFPGHVWLYLGYMITEEGEDQGKIVYSADPIKITIE
jgi:hypothetical protein